VAEVEFESDTPAELTGLPSIRGARSIQDGAGPARHWDMVDGGTWARALTCLRGRESPWRAAVGADCESATRTPNGPVSKPAPGHSRARCSVRPSIERRVVGSIEPDVRVRLGLLKLHCNARALLRTAKRSCT
jgi:hypothetical protein